MRGHKDLGKYIRYMRTKKGYQIMDMVRKLDTSYQYYQLIENGNMIPKGIMFNKIVWILGLDMDYCRALVDPNKYEKEDLKEEGCIFHLK